MGASPEAIPYFVSCHCEEPPSLYVIARSRRRRGNPSPFLRHSEGAKRPKNLDGARDIKRLLRFARNDTKIREFNIKTCEVGLFEFGLMD
ncbi:MAG: hypothetical protein NTW48_03125 [Chloroflexi bacterium]|nr:hypothetical protein [Chloroflexota bacterium]